MSKRTEHHGFYPLKILRRQSGKPQLRMVPMIDVVFLLLIFFLLTANFRSKEGFLPAELPQQNTAETISEIEPLAVIIQPQGSLCQVRVGSEKLLLSHDQFNLLSRTVQDVLHKEGRRLSDPVKLAPTAQTNWDYVVKAYDALWQAGLNNIIFARAD